MTPGPQPGEPSRLIDLDAMAVQSQDMLEVVLEARACNVVMLTCGCLFTENRPSVEAERREQQQARPFAHDLHARVPYVPQRIGVMLTTELDDRTARHVHGMPWLELHLDRSANPPRPSWTPLHLADNYASRPYHV